MVNDKTMVKTLRFATPADGLEAIQKQLEGFPVPPDPSVNRLSLADLTLCEGVFQQRDTATNAYEMEGHVRVLASALTNGAHLDPITIWWGGFGWVVIDGHHRVKAYERRAYTGEIPVVIFEGSTEDALLESSRLNSRDKLVMTPQEKANAAVRFCLLTEKSKSEIVKASGASDGTVASIRRVIRSLRDKGVTIVSMSNKSWKELKEMDRDEPSRELPDFDEHTRKMAEEIRESLLEVLGDNVIHGGDALALALSQMPPELALRAMRSIYWPLPWGEPEDDLEADY